MVFLIEPRSSFQFIIHVILKEKSVVFQLMTGTNAASLAVSLVQVFNDQTEGLQ
jgi:hypothetical protein